MNIPQYFSHVNHAEKNLRRLEKLLDAELKDRPWDERLVRLRANVELALEPFDAITADSHAYMYTAHTDNYIHSLTKARGKVWDGK